MTAVEGRVAPEWLALREPADAAARSGRLVAEVVAAVSAGRSAESAAGSRHGPLVVHDLGCGSGSMLRWLAPRLPGPQHWVLHDRDADLLDLARRHAPAEACDGAPVTVELRRGDLTRLGEEGLAGASLVTASALLDMLTAEELDRVVRSCVAARCPVLLALTVLGHVHLDPRDPLDVELGAAFDDHQRRTDGSRTLLGPDAGPVAVGLLSGLGARVLVDRSPWRLGPSSAPLLAEWLAGWLGPALAQRPELSLPAGRWLARRRRQMERSLLTATVDHLDVLALPPTVAGEPSGSASREAGGARGAAPGRHVAHPPSPEVSVHG